MSILSILGLLALLGVGAALLVVRHLYGMSSKEKKVFFKSTLNGVFIWCEDHGLLQRTPAFQHDYLKTYPNLKIFEDRYEDIRAECLALLESRDRLQPMSSLGGAYTQKGIHTIDWKSFMFKAGDFVEENCRRCPKTAAAIAEVPEVYMAFFSILEPRQQVAPHWGYYKGFVRYHLGVVIPDDNNKQECWLRVNADKHDNDQEDLSLVEKGEVYHWKNGKGIVFDDNYLHDAANGSDEPRVVMWLDVRRKMPFYLDWYNRLCLALVKHDSSIKKIRRNAAIED